MFPNLGVKHDSPFFFKFVLDHLVLNIIKKIYISFSRSEALFYFHLLIRIPSLCPTYYEQKRKYFQM